MRLEITNIKIDHPFFIVFIGHLILFLFAFLYMIMFKPPYDIQNFIKVILVVLGYLIAFYLGTRYNLKIKKILMLALFILSILITYGSYAITDNIFLSFLYAIFVLGILEGYLRYRDKINFNNLFLFIGIASFLLLVSIKKGIPLFNYNIRMSIVSDPLRLISSGALTYAGIGKYFLIAFVILVLLGYKVHVLILCVSYLIYKYRKKSLNVRQMVIFGILLILFIGFMGKVILASSNQAWKLNFMELILYRAYFDIMVLEKIVNYPEILLGKITFVPNGERLIGKLLFNYSHNITSTMFGPLYFDFGVFGVVFAFILGMMSKLIYEKGDDKIYSIYAGVLLAMCEIGINYGFLIVLLALFYVSSRLRK
ncbi:oligosaccharide repeat unit polymerase family protein [Methanotorris igneus]|nr:oligosaccharide repeat unit polymerase [Methanotorris igneus]